MSSAYTHCPDCGKLIRKSRSHIHKCVLQQDLAPKRAKDKRRGARYVQFLANTDTKDNYE